ncbi:MAG: hypothetical protein Q4Q04_06715 [Methanocorpusculum sp.]|nr:hypothetical protein [Methanocorpusculum sp.]
MTESEIPVVAGRLRCTDGQIITPDKCRFCMHSRSFVVDGKTERSPALAFCQRERAVKPVDYMRATTVFCAEKRGDGYANIGNIIA